MRKLLYGLMVVSLLFVPLKKLDVAKLQPVQTLGMRLQEGQIQLFTDTKDTGFGACVADAVENLEERTPGVIYLDTAQYLLVTREAAPYVKELAHYLRQSVRVSLWDGKGSVETAAKYLSVRGDLKELTQWEPPQ